MSGKKLLAIFQIFFTRLTTNVKCVMKKKKWKEIDNKYDIGERGNHNLEGAKLPASHLQFKHTLLTPTSLPTLFYKCERDHLVALIISLSFSATN